MYAMNRLLELLREFILDFQNRQVGEGYCIRTIISDDPSIFKINPNLKISGINALLNSNG